MRAHIDHICAANGGLTCGPNQTQLYSVPCGVTLGQRPLPTHAFKCRAHCVYGGDVLLIWLGYLKQLYLNRVARSHWWNLAPVTACIIGPGLFWQHMCAPRSTLKYLLVYPTVTFHQVWPAPYTLCAKNKIRIGHFQCNAHKIYLLNACAAHFTHKNQYLEWMRGYYKNPTGGATRPKLY